MGAHFILRNPPASGSLLNINADVAQLAEQLICNQQVIGSSPIIGFTGFLPVILKKQVIRNSRFAVPLMTYNGRIPEWPKGTDCKSAGNAFGGSNPPPPSKA